jgi:hypothetical protein
MIPSSGGTVLSVLALVGTTFILICATCLAILATISRNRLLARRAMAGVLGLAIVYAIALVAVGAGSGDRLIQLGEEKYFCELDCHLAYSVTGLRPLRGVAEARGTVWAVTIQTRFDERTISSRRSREAPLSPNPRCVALVAADGAEFPPLPATPEQLSDLGFASTPLTQELRPGESYTTTLLFDLPAKAVPASLDLVEEVFPTRLMIGHERSPFHGRALLALPAAEASAESRGAAPGTGG